MPAGESIGRPHRQRHPVSLPKWRAPPACGSHLAAARQKRDRGPDRRRLGGKVFLLFLEQYPLASVPISILGANLAKWYNGSGSTTKTDPCLPAQRPKPIQDVISTYQRGWLIYAYRIRLNQTSAYCSPEPRR